MVTGCLFMYINYTYTHPLNVCVGRKAQERQALDRPRALSSRNVFYVTLLPFVLPLLFRLVIAVSLVSLLCR